MTPLAWVQRRWREWRLRSALLVMMVPDSTRGAEDAVAAIIPLLVTKLRRFPPIFILDAISSHFDEVLRAVRFRVFPKRVILFAHPTDLHDGFAVNPSQELDLSVLRPDWWRGSRAPIGLLVAHVCEGARVLRQPYWRGLFDAWISYEGVIDGYVASEIGRERWARIANRIMQAAVDGPTPASVMTRMQRAYLDELISIDDKPDYSQGDTINYCNFERAYKQLVSTGGGDDT